MYAGRISSMLYAGKVEEQAVKWRIGGNAFYSRYAAGTRLDDAASVLRIGNNDALNRTFTGDLDDIRIYNRVLAANLKQ